MIKPLTSKQGMPLILGFPVVELDGTTAVEPLVFYELPPVREILPLQKAYNKLNRGPR